MCARSKRPASSLTIAASESAIPTRTSGIHGRADDIPRFLEQLNEMFEVEQSPEPMQSRRVSGPAGGGPELPEIAVTTIPRPLTIR